jgi:hypothetical protein
MDRYQWTVLFAAWLGWGFDIFDSLLFNYVAPTCVPVLLGIPFGTPEAAAATLRWTGILTSLCWSAGQPAASSSVVLRSPRPHTHAAADDGDVFAGTAACALAPNMWALVRFVLSRHSGLAANGCAVRPCWQRPSLRSARRCRARCCIPPHRWGCSWRRFSSTKSRACTSVPCRRWHGDMSFSRA